MATSPEMLGHAWRAYQAGNLVEAARLSRQVLQTDAGNADAWCLLGVVSRALGQLEEAVRAHHEALRLRPDFLEVHNNLGNALLTQGKREEAIACFRQVLRKQPRFAEAHNNLGAALSQQGQLEEAVACFREALRSRPDFADAHSNLGTALCRLGQLDEALAACQQALRLAPQSPEVHNSLGTVLARQNRNEEALTQYQQALELRPQYVEALLNQGNVLWAQRRLAGAEASYRQVLALQPEHPEGHANLGIVLAEQRRWQEAEASYRKAQSLKPNYPEAHSNLGNVLLTLGRVDEALASLDEALRGQPNHVETRMARALALLKRGDLPQGFAEYEWRWKSSQFAAPWTMSRPLWDGSPLPGRTILLAFEQGLGDTLQFIRYAPLVKQLAGTVVVVCQKPLLGLLATCAGIDILVAAGGALPEHDVHAPLLSLPRLFGTTLQTIPAAVPYLAADAELVERWRPKLNAHPGFKVGIVWQGNPDYRWDRYRSVPLSSFAPLARLPGVQLFSLQKGFGSEQLHALPEPFPIIDLGKELDETSGPFLDTTAVLKCLDLVISVDTTIAHLAGALGVSLWLPLSVASHWGWLSDRDDSPWYPTVRLFRQTALGDWEGVFQRLAQVLAERLGVPYTPSPVLPTAAVQQPRPRPDALLAQAWQEHQSDHYAQAESLCRQILHTHSQETEAWRLLGEACLFQAKYAETAAAYQQAVSLGVNTPELHNNLGVALAQLDRRQEAVACYRQALQLRSDYVEAANNLGVALTEESQLEEAVAQLREALRNRPDYAEAHNSLGIALAAQGKLDEAVASYRQALRCRPGYANAHKNLALALLRTGDFTEGWREYEWRWRCRDFPRLPYQQPQWDGTSLPGRTILLHAEQGLGDTLQFIRYAPLVQERVGRVVAACQQALLPLLACCVGIDQLVDRAGPLPPFDVFAPLLSLPYLLGTTLDTIPARVPYLHARADLTEHWRKQLESVSGFRIGIAWQGNPAYPSDRKRSFPLSCFAPLGQLSGVRLISLQKGAGIEQLPEVEGRFPVLDLGERLDEQTGPFLDTAAIMKNLDLVITPCTALAHLAGALGVPVWVVLSLDQNDWRWVQNRDDSPWYPSMRLFRQTALGDWDGVFERLALALRERLAPRKTAQAERPGPIALSPPTNKTAPGGPPMQAVQLPRDWLAQAWRSHQADDYARAELLCRQGVRIDPENGEAWRLLAEACLFQGKHGEASEGYRQALRLGPTPPEVYNNLGVALAQQGQQDEAIRCYRQALQLLPSYVEAANNLGVALTKQSQLEEAVAQLREALRYRPDYAEAHNSLGIALAAQGKLDEAVASYRQALRFRPNYAKAYNNLGIAQAAQGKLDEAVASYQQALQLSPNAAEAGNNLAAALVQQGKLDEALSRSRQAIQANPSYAEAHNNLAVALAAQGQLEDALSSYGRALQLKPDYAESHKNLAMALLQKGDFAAGWREYEWRWQCRDFPRLPYQQPRWNGSPLAGRTILLHAEQGLGDTLQFIRYAPLVKQRGGSVLVACQKPLLALLASCPGIDALVSREGPFPPFDFFVPLLSLPFLLGTTLETIPAEVPYLQARADLIEHWRSQLQSVQGFRIGIAWQGNPGHGMDRFRSFALRCFEPLARVPGVSLVSLQKGPGSEQLQSLADRFPVLDLASKLDETSGPFMDTAAVMKNLDLVVTSDTSVAHLAGALAVPVWVALPFAPDWRWLGDREDSPWYPTMRLFRQTEFGNWDGVFQRIAAALKERQAPRPGPITVEIAPGELLDKITILQIKSERLTNEASLRHVRQELGQLTAVSEKALPSSAELACLTAELKVVNEKLWEIEDAIRLCERENDFGPHFIALARAVYHTNDQRSALKRRINELLGSSLIEEKQYTPYHSGK